MHQYWKEGYSEGHISKYAKESECVMPDILYSQNPTDGNIDMFSNLESEDSIVYSEQWQKETIKNARKNRYIKLYDLVFILAAEEKYSGFIQKLWERFHLNRKIKLLDGRVIDDKEDNLIPKWDPSWINTAQGRANPWYWILLRWTIYPTFFADKVRSIESQYFGYLAHPGENLIFGIKLYKLIGKTFRKVAGYEEQSPTQYIRMVEFRKYLKLALKLIEY